MAKVPSLFTILFHRHHQRKPNFRFRSFNIGVGGTDNGGGELIQTDDQKSSDIGKHEKFTEAAQDISKYILTRPGWEQTLISDQNFSGIDLSDPNLLQEVLKHQKDAVLKVRLFYWFRSQFGSCDEDLCNVVFNDLLESKAVSAAKHFLKVNKFNPDLSSMELYICCLCENERIREAVEVFDTLLERGIWPSLTTWNSVLMCAVRAGNTDFVWKIYSDMLNCGAVPDVETVTCLIEALCYENKVTEGYLLLRQCLQDGNVPSNALFNKLITMFCKEGNFDGVSAVIHSMIANNRTPDIHTYQIIIHWLCEGKMVHESFRIFNNLKDRGYAPNDIMYTTMIHGLCKMRLLGDARKLLFEMIRKGIMPAKNTFIVLIQCLFGIGDIDGAQELYKEMLERGYKETYTNYFTMISGFCLNGKMELACDVFEQMLQKGVDHWAIKNLCKSMIKRLCCESKPNEGKILLYHLLDQGLKPLPPSYIALINTFCELGQLEGAKSLWKDLQDRDVIRQPGSNDFLPSGLNIEKIFSEANSKHSPETVVF